uniref:Uncharacterized protein n=1 Tax=Chromera velia CCMP2878 TaxID=1169474 RepID=A0A0G4I581_9ALVE|eukprot:Cvel_11116.t1-p1 / transcript=Cvel_11116.t1 / gene=Cvel_11116 / organism=Chromera_velia_CCMP2878 / gene_product=hypothetical protein / transcript_product=hypothetical protein / location=Cvel_scaffold688:24934-28183(+) / protein_length=956 / sequence_SO=supercontig / SO=protein_coding / is_pseudo=false
MTRLCSVGTTLGKPPDGSKLTDFFERFSAFFKVEGEGGKVTISLVSPVSGLTVREPEVWKEVKPKKGVNEDKGGKKGKEKAEQGKAAPSKLDEARLKALLNDQQKGKERNSGEVLKRLLDLWTKKGDKNRVGKNKLPSAKNSLWTDMHKVREGLSGTTPYTVFRAWAGAGIVNYLEDENDNEIVWNVDVLDRFRQLVKKREKEGKTSSSKAAARPSSSTPTGGRGLPPPPMGSPGFKQGTMNVSDGPAARVCRYGHECTDSLCTKKHPSTVAPSPRNRAGGEEQNEETQDGSATRILAAVKDQQTGAVLEEMLSWGERSPWGSTAAASPSYSYSPLIKKCPKKHKCQNYDCVYSHPPHRKGICPSASTCADQAGCTYLHEWVTVLTSSGREHQVPSNWLLPTEGKRLSLTGMVVVACPEFPGCPRAASCEAVHLCGASQETEGNPPNSSGNFIGEISEQLRDVFETSQEEAAEREDGSVCESAGAEEEEEGREGSQSEEGSWELDSSGYVGGGDGEKTEETRDEKRGKSTVEQVGESVEEEEWESAWEETGRPSQGGRSGIVGRSGGEISSSVSPTAMMTPDLVPSPDLALSQIEGYVRQWDDLMLGPLEGGRKSETAQEELESNKSREETQESPSLLLPAVRTSIPEIKRPVQDVKEGEREGVQAFDMRLRVETETTDAVTKKQQDVPEQNLAPSPWRQAQRRVGRGSDLSVSRSALRVTPLVVDGHAWGLLTGRDPAALDDLEAFLREEISGGAGDGRELIIPRDGRYFLHPDPAEGKKLHVEGFDSAEELEAWVMYVYEAKKRGWKWVETPFGPSAVDSPSVRDGGGGVQRHTVLRADRVCGGTLAEVAARACEEEQFEPVGGAVKAGMQVDDIVFVVGDPGRFGSGGEERGREILPREVGNDLLESAAWRRWPAFQAGGRPGALRWVVFAGDGRPGDALEEWGRHTRRLLRF